MNHTKMLCVFIVSGIVFCFLAWDMFNVYRVGLKQFHKEKHPNLSDDNFSVALIISWLILILFGVATTVCAALLIKIL